MQQGLRYGVAMQSPLPGADLGPGQSLHCFVEALGRSRGPGDVPAQAPAGWSLLPGLHWRVGDSWWVSGGLIFPLGGSRAEAGLWHLTCAWRF
jgi:hypothetical protein